MLARIPLNRMRLEAAIAGVPFTPPSLLDSETKDLFEYDEAVRTAFDEYSHAVDIGGTLREQVAAHTHSGAARIKGVASSDPDSSTSLILRFFPNNQIEAEYVAQSLKSGAPLDPRVDLLFTGQRVMRHMGE
jgi:hypothetical protein